MSRNKLTTNQFITKYCPTKNVNYNAIKILSLSNK